MMSFGGPGKTPKKTSRRFDWEDGMMVLMIVFVLAYLLK